ncbi:MAG: hypothetical protein GY832_34680 [Chloroflexi bacterium]|nr:hypothetical protein [Chloroflexota bacterium]
MMRQTPQIHLGDPALDFGVGTVPKVTLRFYRYLRHEGKAIPDRLMLMVIQVLALFGGSLELRGSDLPLGVKPKTIENWKCELRAMGLLFTRRIYYPITTPGRPPRLKTIEWDLSSLLFNCLRVGQHWMAGQRELDREWVERGAPEPRPIYTLPDDFSLEITLPPAVVQRIREEWYDPKPHEKWIARANASGNAAQDADSASATLDQIVAAEAGVPSPTSPNRAVGLSHFPDSGSGACPLPGIGQSLITYGTEYAYAYSGQPAACPVPSNDSLCTTETDTGPARGSNGSAAGRPVTGKLSDRNVAQAVPVPMRPDGLPLAVQLSEWTTQVTVDLARLEATGGNCRGRLTKAMGQLLGLELRDDATVRSTPTKSDYAAVGALGRDYGYRRVWEVACRLVGRNIQGQPVPYLRGALIREFGTPEQRHTLVRAPDPSCPLCDGIGAVEADVTVDHSDFGKAVPCPRCQT